MSPGRRCDRAIALFGTTAALFTEAFQRRVGSSIRRPPLSATVLRTPNTGRPCTAASHLFPCHSHCRPKSEGKSQSAALQRSPHTLCITFLFGDSLSLSLSLSLSVCVCVSFCSFCWLFSFSLRSRPDPNLVPSVPSNMVE